MKFIVLIALLIVAAFAGNYNPCSNPVQQNWCDCSPADSDITLLSVTLNPNPVVKGQNVTVSATSVDGAKYSITNGTINVLVKYGFITLLDKSYNLCNELNQAHQKDPNIQGCPVAPFTSKTISYSHLVPDIFPSGTYKGFANTTDQNGRVIQCIQYDMHIA